MTDARSWPGMTKGPAGRNSFAGHLVDAALVAAAFEVGVQPGADDVGGHAVGDEAGREDEDVRVVMGLHETAHLGAPGEAGPDTLVLVQGDGHAVAGAAEGDADLHFLGFDGLGQPMGEVGIVAAHFGVGTVIDNLVAALAQHLHEFLLVFHACVVVANSYFHFKKDFSTSSK